MNTCIVYQHFNLCFIQPRDVELNSNLRLNEIEWKKYFLRLVLISPLMVQLMYDFCFDINFSSQFGCIEKQECLFSLYHSVFHLQIAFSNIELFRVVFFNSHINSNFQYREMILVIKLKEIDCSFYTNWNVGNDKFSMTSSSIRQRLFSLKRYVLTSVCVFNEGPTL